MPLTKNGWRVPFAARKKAISELPLASFVKTRLSAKSLIENSFLFAFKKAYLHMKGFTLHLT